MWRWLLGLLDGPGWCDRGIVLWVSDCCIGVLGLEV